MTSVLLPRGILLFVPRPALIEQSDRSPPRFTLGVNDLQYLLTFAVLLVVALITAELAARLRHERDVVEARGGRPNPCMRLRVICRRL